jgi:hypothetical protein
MSNRTYYRGPEISITDVYFVRRGSTNRAFAIADLRDVVISKGKGGKWRPYRRRPHPA